MPKLGLRPKQKGQLALLVSIGKDIAAHERELADLRQLEKKLIRQFERSKYQAEIDELRALVVNYENGVCDG